MVTVVPAPSSVIFPIPTQRGVPATVTNPIQTNYGTYNPYTKVYTDPNGNKSSRPIGNIPPGTNIDWNANPNLDGGGGGGSHRPQPQPQPTPTPAPTPNNTPNNNRLNGGYVSIGKTNVVKQNPNQVYYYSYFNTPGYRAGTYTSTGLFYPDTGAGNKFKPTGKAVKGYIDATQDKYVSVIPYEDVGSTRSAKGGGVYTQKIQYDDTGKSMQLQSNPNINPKTGLPYGVVTSGKEPLVTYKDYTKDEGYIQGTLSYFGSRFSAGIDKYQMKSGNYYQQEAFRNIGQYSPQGVYFTPYAGTSLFAASGVEKIYKGKNIKEKAIGLGELGLGVFGLKSEIKTIKATKEIEAIEKSPTFVNAYRLEADKKGVDILFGVKKTKYGTYISKVQQPYHLVGENKFTLEGGKAMSIGIKKPNKIDVSLSETYGRGVNLENTPRVGKMKLQEPYLLTEPTRIGKDVEGYSSVFGKVGLKEKYRGQLKYNIDMLNQRGSVHGTLKPSDYSSSSFFIGGGKREEDVITFFGTKADTLRVQKTEGFNPPKMSLSGYGSRTYGIIKVKRLPSSTDSFILGKGLGLKKVSQSPAYGTELIQESMKAVVKPKEPIQKNVVSESIVQITRNKEQSHITQLTQTKQSQQVKPEEKVSFGLVSNTRQVESQALQPMTRQRQVFSLAGKNDTMLKDNQEYKFGLANIQGLAQAQSNKQAGKLRLIELSNNRQSERTPKEFVKPFTYFNENDSSGKKKEFGYIALGKRRGKFKPLISKPVTKERAFEIGKSFGDFTLGRTFKLVKTKQLVESKKKSPFSFTSDASRYRTYQVRKGKAIGLTDTYIQKSKFALSSASEKREIKQARRSKGIGSAFGI